MHVVSFAPPGYGNIAPSTEGGKIFCILYAIFGIPLFGFLLAGVGDQLGTIFVKSIAKVEKMFRVSTNVNVVLSMTQLCGNNMVVKLMFSFNMKAAESFLLNVLRSVSGLFTVQLFKGGNSSELHSD